MKNKNYQMFGSESGAVILVVMVLVALVASLIGLSMSATKNYVDQSVVQNNLAERAKVFSTMKSLMGDQRVCSSLFQGGIATAAGTYDFDSTKFDNAKYADKEYISKKIAEVESHFDKYRVSAIILSNPQIIKTDGNNVQYMQYEVAFQVGNKNANFFTTEGRTFGARLNGVARTQDEDINLIISSNGQCFLHDNQAAINGEQSSIVQACAALGGVYQAGSCHIKEFAVDTKTQLIADPLAIVQDPQKQSTFSDALCEMEFKAMQQMGPHLTSQLATQNQKLDATWTNFCQKPRWTGCRASNNPDNLLVGNDPNSKDFRLPGAQWTATSEPFKASNVPEYINKVADPTIYRRQAHVATSIINTRMVQGLKLDIDAPNTSFFGQIKNVLSTSKGRIVFLAFGPIVALLAPKCNKARVTVAYRCADGFSEVDNLHIEVQKLKISFSGFKCQWKSAGDQPIPNEGNIMAIASNLGYKLNTPPFLTSDLATKEDLDALTKAINGTINLTQFYGVATGTNEPLAPDEEAVGSLPPEVMGLFSQQELKLWTEFNFATLAALNVIESSVPLAQGAETADEYKTYLTTFYNTQQTQLKGAADQLSAFYAQAVAFKNADGTDRDLTSIQTTVVNPLSAKMLSMQTTLGSNATAGGVTITAPTFASLP